MTSPTRSPREVLRLYHQAMLHASADELADLYAEDAVHEFSFPAVGRPDRCDGREAVRVAYRDTWARFRDAVTIESIEEMFVRDAGDPEVVVGQWRVKGRLRKTGTPVNETGLMFLQVRDGLIVHARDFLDGLDRAA